MKKIIPLILCLLLLPASVALADNASLEGTTWELGMIAVIGTDERFDSDYIEENNLMIRFRFEENSVVILSMPNIDFSGVYQLDGNELDMDFQDDGHIWTTVNESDNGIFIFSFVNIFEEGQIHLFLLREGTFAGSAPAALEPEPAVVEPTPDTQPETPQPETPLPETPATSDSAPERESTTTSGSGMPRLLRDALWGGVLGAVIGSVVWLIGRGKKKKKAAAAAAMHPGTAPMPPDYYSANPSASHGHYPANAQIPPNYSAGISAPVTPAHTFPSSFSSGQQLYCQGGPMAGATFPVHGTLRIGRDPAQCQIIFPAEAAGISALHCEIQQQPSGILLIDCNSTYGTFLLNGRKLNANESVVLGVGDGFYLAENQNLFKVL